MCVRGFEDGEGSVGGGARSQTISNAAVAQVIAAPRRRIRRWQGLVRLDPAPP